MTQLEYLQSQRMSEAEHQAFLTEYGIPSQRESHDDFPSADDSYEAHTHHAEYGGGAH